MLQHPNLRTLNLCCLQILRPIAGSLVSLEILRLYLAESWYEMEEISRSAGCDSAVCMTLWPEHEMNNILLAVSGLHELQVKDNPEIVSELAVRHHKATLRKQVFLHRLPLDRNVV